MVQVCCLVSLLFLLSIADTSRCCCFEYRRNEQKTCIFQGLPLPAGDLFASEVLRVLMRSLARSHSLCLHPPPLCSTFKHLPLRWFSHSPSYFLTPPFTPFLTHSHIRLILAKVEFPCQDNEKYVVNVISQLRCFTLILRYVDGNGGGGCSAWWWWWWWW